MDATYWKTRCEAAESALQRARGSLSASTLRVEVIKVLGGLKPGEYMATSEVARALEWDPDRAFTVLANMERAGMADREPSELTRGRGNQVRWKLGHLVQVPE